MSLETRVPSLEAVLAQINARLGNIEQELRDMRKETQSNRRWLVGMQLTTLLILGTLILFKLGEKNNAICDSSRPVVSCTVILSGSEA